MNDERVGDHTAINLSHESAPAEISSDHAQRFLLSPIAVTCLAATAWIVSLSLGSLFDVGRGLMAWPVVSQARWDGACPECGTIEGVVQLREPHGPGRIWRIDVRMAGGQLRQFRSVNPLTPGQRVTVKAEQLLPMGETAMCR
jgi:hypothetical protein